MLNNLWHMPLSTTRALRVKHFVSLCPVIYSFWSKADFDMTRVEVSSVINKLQNNRRAAPFRDTIHFSHLSKVKRLVDLSRFTLELNSLEVKFFLLTKETYYTSCIELDLGKKDTNWLSSRFPEKIFMISNCSIEGQFQYVESNKN